HGGVAVVVDHHAEAGMGAALPHALALLTVSDIVEAAHVAAPEARGVLDAVVHHQGRAPVPGGVGPGDAVTLIVRLAGAAHLQGGVAVAGGARAGGGGGATAASGASEVGSSAAGV